MPFNILSEWIKKEKALGVKQPDYAVLSTVSEGVPRSRVVAIREMKDDNLFFFTSTKTRKVAELLKNPAATINFLFTLQERQVVLEGYARPLTALENQFYWNTLPRERQLRFNAYAPHSGEEIDDVVSLEKEQESIARKFLEQPIPISACYMGFCFIPETFLFYALGQDAFSDVFRFTKTTHGWEKKRLSP